MFNLQFNNIIHQSYSFIRDTFSNSNDISKRVQLVAIIALSSLTALYLAFKYCCCSLNKKELFSDDGYSDDQFDDIPTKSVFSKSPSTSYSTSFMDESEYESDTESDSDPHVIQSHSIKIPTQPITQPNSFDVHLDNKDNVNSKQKSAYSSSPFFDISDYANDDDELPKEFQVNTYSPPLSQKFKDEPKKSPTPFSAQKQALCEKERAAIDAIQGRWLDNPKDEVQRILNAHILPSSLKKSSSPQYMSSSDLDTYVVMGRALELKKYYKDTHYVFTHGQAPEISIVNEFLKTCIRIFTPDQYHPYRPTFRLPNTITYFKNVTDYITKYHATSSSFKDDGVHSHEIISVDAQFANEAPYESALYFFSQAKNIGYHADSGKLKNIFKLNFLNFLPVEAICNDLAAKAEAIALKRKQETKVGVLYAICVPKSVVQDEKTNIAYASHAYGRACTCAINANRIKKLEDMQQDIVTTCDGGKTQYRILTPRLMEEKEARCFPVTPLSKIKKNHYQDEIAKVVNELKVYSHLYALIEELDENNPDEVLLMQIESLKETEPKPEQKYIDLLYAAAKTAKMKTTTANEADIINKMNAEAAHLKT